MKLITTLFIVLSLALRASCLTTFTFQLYNSDGSPETNPATLAPVGGNQITVYGTNIVIAKTVTLMPGTNGFGTNSAEPNAYKLSIPTSTGVPIATFANIPDTATVFPLAMYISNAPAIFVASSLQAMLTNALGISSITNLLGLVPMPATRAGVTNALGYLPLTNSPAGMTNVLGFALIPPTFPALTNALGLVPLASNYFALTNLIAGAPVLANNPQFTLALTNANLFYATNIPLLRGFMALNGLTNAFTTNADGSFTPLVGWTNQTFPQFTGIVGYTNSSGTASRLYITNGIIVTNTTP